MDLANMRRQGVRSLIAYCLNDSCRHQAIIDVSSYPGDTPVPWFESKVKCGKCGARGRRIDVRPNWKEKPGMPDNWQGRQFGRSDAERRLNSEIGRVRLQPTSFPCKGSGLNLSPPVGHFDGGAPTWLLVS
jgi:hypothetical protein